MGARPPKKPGDPAAPAGGTPARAPAGSEVAASRIAGAAVAQDCGTDNEPTVAAPPRPADTPAPPGPTEPAVAAAAGAAAAAAAAAAGIAPACVTNAAMPEAANGMILKLVPAAKTPTAPMVPE